MTALNSAKQSGNPEEVTEAARLLLAPILQQLGELQVQEGSPLQAIETFRRSLDFEDASGTRGDLAIAYLVPGQTDKALSVVTDILTADPQSPRGWYLQGRVWMAKKLYDHAIEAFTRALSLQANQEISYWLGAAYLQAKQPDKAHAIFQNLLDHSADRARLHARFSDAYRDSKYIDDAERELRLAVQLDPKIARTQRPRATVELELLSDQLIHDGDHNSTERVPATAQQMRKQEAKLHKIVAGGLNDLGTAEARQQKFVLALAHFHEAETWQPDTPGLQRNVGIAAMRTSNYPEAVRALRPVVAQNSHDMVARASLGSALFATNAFAEAAQTLRPLGDSIIQHSEVAYALASSLIKTNQYADATSLLNKMAASQLSPQMLLLVAQAWSQMGIYPRAVEACHRALQTNPKLAGAHYLAGLALIRQDRAAEAGQEFRDELQLDPENAEAQFNLAFVLLQQSQEAEALILLRKVLARNPDHAEANYEIGKQLFADGNAPDAIPYLEAAARLKPAFEPVHYQLQAAYRAVGRKEEADSEAKIYRQLKAKSRNITLPPPREPANSLSDSN
jgi:tetratricopeptide (TPR) repeat protein